MRSGEIPILIPRHVVPVAMDSDFDQLSPAAIANAVDRFRLPDDVALITGGGGGMGRAIAFAFASAGADIALADRRLDGMDRVSAELNDHFDVTTTAIQTDVAEEPDVDHMVDATVDTLGDLDILLNIAGLSTYTKTEDMTTKAWDLVQAVNLRGSYLAARAAYPHLKNGGRVLNISSIAALYGAETMSHYAAAKAGVRTLTRSLGTEWAPDNIRVNAVAPGPILTPGAANLYAEQSFDPFDIDHEEASDRTHVNRPVGSPAEIADTFLFLASPAASYITGETITVAGPPPSQEYVMGLD